MKHEKLGHYSKAFQIRIEEYLDAGIGSCYLSVPEIAELVQDALLFYDNTHYLLLSWVIMPNHLHMLIRPMAKVSLSKVMRDLKGFTARKANMVLGRDGAFWQPDYFDRYIQDQEHYFKALRYIERNPVKVGLCSQPEAWPYGSARLRGADSEVRVPS
ncbi:MAG: transposase [Pyrinomonadaceae bacterium]